MRTVIVENVETAEAKKQRLATTAVDAALEILRTEASGLVIEAAAPLVFQGLCRRDNIRVEFTQTPMTNGRVIWLGPIEQARVHLRLRTRMPRTSSRDVHQLRGDEGDR